MQSRIRYFSELPTRQRTQDVSQPALFFLSCLRGSELLALALRLERFSELPTRQRTLFVHHGDTLLF